MGSGTVLLVATPGGHVDELVRLARRLSDEAPVVWATSRNTQTESLLSGLDVEWIPHVGPRGVVAAVTSLPAAVRLLGRRKIDHVVTTGAALAVPYLWAARSLGRKVSYIESAARQAAPSVTGRIAAATPGVRLYCQAPVAFGGRWTSVGSVFDDFVSGGERPMLTTPRSVVVSLGGERFGFRRAVERLVDQIPAGVDVVWQTGSTPAADLVPSARSWLDPVELRAAVARADAVITHAGVGSALAALDAGRVPVLLPRRVWAEEHVDDHQLQIADELARRGLAVVRDASSVLWADVVEAASRTVVVTDRPPAIRLR